MSAYIEASSSLASLLEDCRGKTVGRPFNSMFQTHLVGDLKDVGVECSKLNESDKVGVTTSDDF